MSHVPSMFLSFIPQNDPATSSIVKEIYLFGPSLLLIVSRQNRDVELPLKCEDAHGGCGMINYDAERCRSRYRSEDERVEKEKKGKKG